MSNLSLFVSTDTKKVLRPPAPMGRIAYFSARGKYGIIRSKAPPMRHDTRYSHHHWETPICLMVVRGQGDRGRI